MSTAPAGPRPPGLRRPTVVVATQDLPLPSVVRAANDHLAQERNVLFVGGPDVVGAGERARMEELAASDPRIATVSVHSDMSGDSTVRLVDFATGEAVLLCASAVQLVGGLERGPESSLDASLVDFSLRARARGLFDLALARVDGAAPALLDDADHAWLAARHPTLFTGLLADAERPTSVHSTSTLHPTIVEPVVDSEMASDRRLRILVDDTTLGPYETGAQITTLAIVRALAARDDVAAVTVALRNGIPPYARDVLGAPKVRPWIRTGDSYDGAGRHDVVHRTTQPDAGFSVARARQCAPRVVVTLLDLIGYRGGHYFGSTEEWLGYRRAIREAVAEADAVTTISRDVARIVELERLPVALDRLFPVLYGTDHLTGTEVAELPRGMVTSGSVADEFVLCLGTDYLHKNRDVARAVHDELRARGRRITLVLAGAAVPFGGSSATERTQRGDEDDVVVLPSVSPVERNWLLRHARVVLYPTSAEGFGLVPFEAARFGTPTVHVPFGPFLETLPGEQGMPEAWDAAAFADAVDELLADPDVRQRRINAVLDAGSRCTWRRTAAEYVAMYRAQPDPTREHDV